MKVRWTPRAIADFHKVLEYLYDSWGVKEVESFINQTDDILEKIAINPQMFIESSKKNIRKGLITKHNSLFYKIKSRKKEIILLTFWDNRKDPGKLHY